MKQTFTLLFLLFTILYTYHFQPYLLEMIQYAWSGGKTHYDPIVGTIVLTIVMSTVAFVSALLTRLPLRLFTLVFFPCFLLLGLLTAVCVQGVSVTTSMLWLIASPVLLVAFVYFTNVANKYRTFLLPLRSLSFLSQPWWSNSLIMVGMMMLTYAMGNSDRTLHTRLAVEHLAKHQLYDEALATGIPAYDNDSSLTMLRAMTLALSKDNTTQRNLLGERLFKYQITGSSRSLFPQIDHSSAFLLGNSYNLWQTLGFVPRDFSEPVAKILKRELCRGHATKAAQDYLLCAYLLDRDLDSFVSALPHYYSLDATLPQHYREALVLYTKGLHKEVLLKDADAPYHDAAMEADYSDFLSLMRKFRDPVLRNSALCDAYFGTYWYYYNS